MAKLNNQKSIFTYLLLFLLISIVHVANCSNIENNLIMTVEIKRLGSFLQKPSNNPIEILRRTGRIINKKWPKDKNSIFIGIFRAPLTKRGFVSITEEMMSKKQLRAVNALVAKYSNNVTKLDVLNSSTQNGFLLNIICDSKVLLKRLNDIINTPKQLAKLNEKQRLRLKKQIIPLLGLSDYLVSKLTLTKKGLFGKLKIHVSNISKEEIKKLHFVTPPLTVGKYIDSHSLFSMCQSYSYTDAKTIVTELRKIPQTKVIESYLASAGLSLEKDILPFSAKEAIVILNLEPSGAGGIPDVRLVAPIANYEKKQFNSMLEKLKNICSQLGIFVKLQKDKVKTVQLSYFLFPQYSLFCGIEKNILVLATGKENLIKEINHISQVNSGNIKPYTLPSDAQLYLLVKFDDFNRQLQMLLQSPLLRDKGIPPISNLTSLDDLEKLEFIARTDTNNIVLELNIPFKKNTE